MRFARSWVAVALAGLVAAAGPAWAQATYGTLSNFDVFNDTGEDCHGFEIELTASRAPTSRSPSGALPAVREPGRGGFPGRRVRPLREPVRLDEPDVHRRPRRIAPTRRSRPRPATPAGRAGRPTISPAAASTSASACAAIRPAPCTAGWSPIPPTPASLQPAGTKVSIPAPAWNVAPAGRRRPGGPRGHSRRAAGGRGAVRRRHVGQGVRDRVARPGRAPSPGHGRPRSAAGAERDRGGVGDPAGRSAGRRGRTSSPTKDRPAPAPSRSPGATSSTSTRAPTTRRTTR